MLSPHLQPGACLPSATVSPRMTNKEPFRPTPRAPIAARTKSDDMVNSFLTLSNQDDYPSASSSGSRPAALAAALPRRLVTSDATSSAPTSPAAERNPFFPSGPSMPLESPTKKLRLTRSTANLRPSSPIKLSAPAVSRAAPVQATVTVASGGRTGPLSRPMTPSAPSISPETSATSSHPRPSSPIKVRAKVTEGISPRKKPVKGPPPKPNIVKRDPQQGLGISVEKAPQRSALQHCYDGEESIDANLSSSSALDYEDCTRGDTDTVSVHLRLKPLPHDEPSAWVASPLASSICLQPALSAGRSSGMGNHNFDAVHVGSSNDALYKSLARPLVSSVLSGFNALIFAYGQTASGKTFTLSGDDTSGAEGITQMAVKDLFKGIRSSKREREWLVRCSWIEVYNEAVKDLLEPSNIPQIRTSTSKGTFVSPLAEIIVTSPAATFELLEQGQKHRHVNATDWNERSSRSHTAFKIVVESWGREDSASPLSLDETDSPRPASPIKGKKVRVSELVLVDLAGSEKYVTRGGQDRRVEGANINKSLLTLGKVIFALSEKGAASSTTQHQHIPYRDSKLTRILQNSLSGNSKIAVVATLNQTIGSIEESLSTIMFAKRIKKVQLSAQLNEVDAPESSGEAQALLVRYKREADDLRRLVRELQDRDRSRGSVDANASDAGNAATQEYIEQVEERLKVLGSCVVRGEGLEDAEMEDVEESSTNDKQELTRLRRSHIPVNRPATPSHLDFTVSTAALRQQLHAATRRITSLEAKKVPTEPDQKDEQIAQLQRRLLEAEIALEASTLQPLPKVREDVEAEYLPRIAKLEKQLHQAQELNDQCMRECERLQRDNRSLIALAHKQTSDLVGKLKEETQLSPIKDRSSRKEASLDLIGGGGGGGAELHLTPTVRRLREMGSGNGTGRERPKSVLGDMGMRNQYASPQENVSPSPLKHKVSSKTLSVPTPPHSRSNANVNAPTNLSRDITSSSSSSSLSSRRSLSHDFSLTPLPSSSSKHPPQRLDMGMHEEKDRGRKTSKRVRVRGGGGNGGCSGGGGGSKVIVGGPSSTLLLGMRTDSDEENADESALVSF